MEFWKIYQFWTWLFHESKEQLCVFVFLIFDLTTFQAVYEKQLSEETSGMVYDRLRRDLAGSDSLGDSHQTAKNGTVFIDGKCILMYFKELTFMFASGSFSVSPHNNTGLKYLVTPECASNSTRRCVSSFA